VVAQHDWLLTHMDVHSWIDTLRKRSKSINPKALWRRGMSWKCANYTKHFMACNNPCVHGKNTLTPTWCFKAFFVPSLTQTCMSFENIMQFSSLLSMLMIYWLQETPSRRSHGSKSSCVKFAMPLLGPLSLYLGV
jgi:hypothetical protein